jgi:hypothetical protein
VSVAVGDCPSQIIGELTVTVGFVTVTLEVAELEHPPKE